MRGGAELANSEPIGLQYFRAVDVMVNGLKPDDGKYFNILVYKNGVELPSVTILRIQSNYQDGTVGKQDEIELKGKGNRLQFNAECDSSGEYVQYPLQISENGSKYLADTVKELTEISAVDGSHIYINHSLSMIAKGGMWWQVEKGSTLSNPRLVAPKKQLNP